ncbi:MAG: pilus assembly protein PilM [Oscillospiraceae bacterium]|nr:pilus assembly protein PilM [Oscillospiraceae bacterium]MDD4402381.1 pilus assembly protein PilM [Desulfitobacteriaceae bacterium]
MLSIDIGSKQVCVVQGSYRKDNVTIDSSAVTEYDNEVVENGVIKDRPALSFAINEIVKSNRMSSKNAVVTINSSDIIAREFVLPNVKLQNLGLIVKNEMYRILGDNSGHVVDFVITETKADNTLAVMAYAVRKDIVKSYYMLLKELKLRPVALEVHANSMSKLLSNTTINGTPHNEDNIIVADIGYSQLAFHGFSKGSCRFNRTEVSLVQEFVREMSSVYRVEVTRTHLENLNFSPDYEYESTVISDTCKYFIYRLSEEIQKYIQYIMLNTDTKTVAQVFICGGISSIKGIDTALSKQMKIPVEVLQSVGRLTLPRNCAPIKLCNAAGALIRL